MIVLVPTTLPPDFGRAYIRVLADRGVAGGYLAVVAATPTCDGGTACTYATIEGSPGAPPLPPGRNVVIAGKMNSVSEKPCGANCAGSYRTTFIAHGATYTISIKAGRLHDAIIIERGLRPRLR